MIIETTQTTNETGGAEQQHNNPHRANRAGELFTAYKVQQTKRRGRAFAYTIAGSLALHTCFVLAVAFVPSVSSALYLAGMFQGAEFADEDYRRGVLKEDIGREAVVVDANELFQYPDGYFSPNAFDPQPLEVTPSEVFPEAFIVSTAKQQSYKDEPLFPTPTPTPKPTPEVVKLSPSPITKSSPEIAQNNTNSATASPSPTPIDAQTSEPEAGAQMEKAAAESGVKLFPKINSRPFKDLLAKGKQMQDAGEIDLNGALEMTVEAVRQDDGTLAEIRIISTTGTPALQQLAKDFVLALSDSRALIALEGAKNLRLNVTLDDKNVSTRVTSEMETAELAKKRADGYSGVLTLAQTFGTGGKEAVQIYKNTKVTSDKRQIVLTFAMPREQAGQLLAQQLSKS